MNSEHLSSCSSLTTDGMLSKLNDLLWDHEEPYLEGIPTDKLPEMPKEHRWMTSSEHERDTQFAEWASLLIEEINEDFRSLNLYYDDGDEQSVEETRKGIETSISRRVYDLAHFIVSQAYEDELKPDEILHKNGKPVLMYPENLKEWYKEKSQCQN